MEIGMRLTRVAERALPLAAAAMCGLAITLPATAAAAPGGIEGGGPASVEDGVEEPFEPGTNIEEILNNLTFAAVADSAMLTVKTTGTITRVHVGAPTDSDPTDNLGPFCFTPQVYSGLPTIDADDAMRVTTAYLEPTTTPADVLLADAGALVYPSRITPDLGRLISYSQNANLGMLPSGTYTAAVFCIEDRTAPGDYTATAYTRTFDVVDLSAAYVPGTQVVVTVSGLKPDREYSVAGHSTVFCESTATSDSTGTLSFSCTLPEDLEPGIHHFTVDELDGTEAASIEFAVDPEGTNTSGAIDGIADAESAPPASPGPFASLDVFGSLGITGS
ncbi:hypothetical protein [Tomitella cavernea]|nr:hypothetical protein [Tomitella cavernea]